MMMMMFRMISSRVPKNTFRQSLPGAFCIPSPSGRIHVSFPNGTPKVTRIAPRYFSAAAAAAAAAVSSSQDFFAPVHETFQSIGVSSPILQSRIDLERPSAVQAAAYTAISEGGDVTIGAETGSGKTLAYLLPLLNDILTRKKDGKNVGYDHARAIILVPNKELVQQVVRMAIPLCGGKHALVYGGGGGGGPAASLPTTKHEDSNINDEQMVRLAIMPGGLKTPQDFQPFRQSIGLGGSSPPVDIVISTPAAIGPLALSPKNIDMFADIGTLVIDEADMLLDGGYIRQLENVLMGFRRADRLNSDFVEKTQHVFVAATLPDMGLRSVDAYLLKKFPNATRVTMAGMHNAKHYGLRDHTVWMETNGNKERMERFVELLQTCRKDGGLQKEKVIVFLNSAEDVDGAHGALGCVFCFVQCLHHAFLYSIY
jgi:superfamily II DNA/RNA helicase